MRVTDVRVGRGGRGRGPRGGDDECVDELNGQGNDQRVGANGSVERVNRNSFYLPNVAHVLPRIDNAAKDEDSKCWPACCRITRKVMDVRVGRGERGRGPKGGNDERVDELNGQGNDQGVGANGGVERVNENVKGVNGGVGGAPDFSTIIVQQLQNLLPIILAQFGNARSQNSNVVNENVQENVRNVLVNNNQVGCSYKEFLACNPKEYDVKGGAVVLTRWLVPHLVTPKSKKIERYMCALALQIRGMVTATEPKTMQKAVQIFGALTDEDKNGRDDNKRTRTGNAFATTANPIRRENTGAWPKYATCNSYHAPGWPCRTCFNCNRPGHFAKDCKVMPRNVNPVNIRKPAPARGACYECESTDHLKPVCPRLNKAQGAGEEPPNQVNQVVANNGVRVVETKRTRLGVGHSCWEQRKLARIRTVDVPRNVNPVNARNPTARACYECGSIDHVRSACPRMNRAQVPGETRPNQA
nr:hypothetical protein [Tanacetum cinerariifolium]